MKKQSASGEDTGGVTWAEIARRLRRAGVSISRATVRKYQEKGLIPAPHPVGRTGKGPGVDWVWTQEQAESVVAKIKQLRTESKARQRLRRVGRKELHDKMYSLFREAREVMALGGCTYLTHISPSETRQASLGAHLIEVGLDNLDESFDRPGMLVVVYAPDPEPLPSEESDGQ